MSVDNGSFRGSPSGVSNDSSADLRRKMNPMKLLDSGADFLSSAVKSAVKGIKDGPSVAERISGLRKKDEETRGGAVTTAVNLYRVSVSVEQFKGDASNASYKLNLFDKQSNTNIHTAVRSWARCESVISVVRSLCPKMEAPTNPATSGRNAAVLAEERRKFIQAFVNFAIAHPTASKIAELRELTGIKDFEETKEHDARMTREPSEREPVFRRRTDPSPEGSIHGSAAGLRHDDERGPSSPRASFQRRPTGQERKVVQIDSSSEEERSAIESCFRVLDVDGLGRITRDEMGELFTAFAPHVSQRLQDQCLEDCDKDNGAFDKKAFLLVVGKIAQRSLVPVATLVGAFQDLKFAQLYSIIGQGGSDEFDDRELRTLVFVLRVSGVRLLTEKEVEKTDITIPVSLPDFCELMEALTLIIPLADVLKALIKSRDHSKLLQLVNRYATRSNPAHVRNLRDRISRMGGGGTTAKCANCDQIAKAKVVLETRLADIVAQNEALQKKVEVLTSALLERDEKLREMSDSSSTKVGIVSEINKRVAELENQVRSAKTREEELMSRLCDAEAELDIERDRSSAWTSNNSSEAGDGTDDEGTVDASSLYFLAPLQLGSSDRAPVVDLPGALVYTLPSSFFPLGLCMDILLRSDGVEYLACRDALGRRSCGWTIEAGTLTCPWAGNSFAIPKGKWARLRCRFHWGTKTFDLELDDIVVAAQTPMRDANVDGLSTLDVFPRVDVVLCYANMHFFR